MLACNNGEACSVGTVQSTVTVSDLKCDQHTAHGGVLPHIDRGRRVDKHWRTVVEVFHLNVHCDITCIEGGGRMRGEDEEEEEERMKGRKEEERERKGRKMWERGGSEKDWGRGLLLCIYLLDSGGVPMSVARTRSR